MPFSRQTYSKAKPDDTKIFSKQTLLLATKAKDDTAAPNRLAPALIAFVDLLPLPITPRNLPNHNPQLEKIKDFREKQQ